MKNEIYSELQKLKDFVKTLTDLYISNLSYSTKNRNEIIKNSTQILYYIEHINDETLFDELWDCSFIISNNDIDGSSQNWSIYFERIEFDDMDKAVYSLRISWYSVWGGVLPIDEECDYFYEIIFDEDFEDDNYVSVEVFLQSFYDCLQNIDLKKNEFDIDIDVYKL
jgi:hypothetical protein